MSIIVADTLRSRAGSGVTITGGLNVGGAVTATSFDGAATGLTGTPDITVRNVTGVAATFTGVLTYEDVTNVDSVGVITARGGIEIGAGGVGGTISPGGNVKFTGITTVGAGLSFVDDIKAKFGTGGDLCIYHDGSNSYIKDVGTGDLKIQGASDVVIEDTSGSNSAVFNTDGSVELYYRGASAGKKLETTTSGVIVTGVTTSTSDVLVGSAITMYASSGIVSATSFHGDGSNLSGLSGGFSNMAVLTSGTSWSIPAGVTKIKVFCTGAGGGGGKGTNQISAGSGGAGGTSIHYFDTSAGGSATYAIGVGGNYASSTSSAASAGTDSTFAYGGTTITGGGGAGGGSSASSGTVTRGGAGGTASGGTLNLTGGAGSSGYQDTDGNERVAPVMAGSSYWGGSGAPGGIEDSSNPVGSPSNIGCGGIGGKNWNSNSGSDGLIVIEY